LLEALSGQGIRRISKKTHNGFFLKMALNTVIAIQLWVNPDPCETNNLCEAKNHYFYSETKPTCPL
jgi:hypothetical protein